MQTFAKIRGKNCEKWPLKKRVLKKSLHGLHGLHVGTKNGLTATYKATFPMQTLPGGLHEVCMFSHFYRFHADHAYLPDTFKKIVSIRINPMNQRLYNFALKYISAGFCPIPVWPDRRKNPRLSSIMEYRERLPEPTEWARWAQIWPNSNLALLTGFHGNLCGLDFDSIGAYNAWHMNVSPQWRETWITETARGRHVYFITAGDPGKDGLFVRQHNEVLLRAKGGAYLIAPPSIHYTGKAYRTVVNHAPVVCQVRHILAGWVEKVEDKPAGQQRPRPIYPTTAARPNILDYVPAYSKHPNSRGAYQCFCPFHDDDHPSAWVNPEQNRFGCNACFRGKWYDVVNVIAMLKGLDNNELMKNLYHRGDALEFKKAA